MSLANYPYYLLPILGSHEITRPIADAGYTVVLPFSGALTTKDIPESVTVEALLESSGSAYLKCRRYPAGSQRLGRTFPFGCSSEGRQHLRSAGMVCQCNAA